MTGRYGTQLLLGAFSNRWAPEIQTRAFLPCPVDTGQAFYKQQYFSSGEERHSFLFSRQIIRVVFCMPNLDHKMEEGRTYNIRIVRAQDLRVLFSAQE